MDSYIGFEYILISHAHKWEFTGDFKKMCESETCIKKKLFKKNYSFVPNIDMVYMKINKGL